MDDTLTGAKNVQTTINICHNIDEKLKFINYVSRKYRSDFPEHMNTIEPNLIKSSLPVDFCEKKFMLILGVS